MSRAMGVLGKHNRLDQEKAAYMHLVQNADSDTGSIEESGMGLDCPSPRTKPGTLRRFTIITMKAFLLLLALWGICKPRKTHCDHYTRPHRIPLLLLRRHNRCGSHLSRLYLYASGHYLAATTLPRHGACQQIRQGWP